MSGDLINTLEAPGEFDALATLRPGEPYFLLVGRDRKAPPLIYEWADRNRRRALEEFEGGLISKERRDRELRKSTQAEMIAESMVEYKNEWAARAEQTERPVQSYTGHEMPAHIKRRDEIVSARARAASALHNAIAELNDLRVMLSESDPAEAALGALATVGMDEMREVADQVTPKRPRYQAAPLLERADGDESQSES